MGQVYRAAHVRIASLFAVKVLYGEGAHDAQMKSRFLREAEASSCLSSRHIVRIFDFGESPEGLSYLAMEYIEGTSLGAVLERTPVLPEAEAARIVRQIARGLAHAHERGIVHRDLKPENVMMADDDEDERVAKLLDFGLARVQSESRLTRAGQIFGTPQYMSPEQFQDGEIDARADLYALGVMLFEMLTGGPPFEARSLGELAQMHVATPPPSLRGRPSGAAPSAGIEAIALRLLAKSPADRFPSARAVSEALRPFAQALPEPPVSISTRRPRALPEQVPAAIEAAICEGSPIYNAGDHEGCRRVYTRTAEELLAGVLARGQAAASARLRVAIARAARAGTPSEGAWEMRHAFDDLLHAADAERPLEGPAGPLGVEIAVAEILAAPRYASGHLDLVGDYYIALALHLAARLREESGETSISAYLDSVADAAIRMGGGQRALSYVREALSMLTAGTDTTVSGAPLPSLPPASLDDSCPGLEAFAERVISALGVGVPAYNAGDMAACRRVYRQAAEAIVSEIGAGPACARLGARLRAALAESATLGDDKAAWALRHAFDNLLAAAARRRG